LNKWTHLALRCKYDQDQKLSGLRFYINNQFASAVEKPATIFLDDPENDHLIGTRIQSSSFEQFYNGFMYSVKILATPKIEFANEFGTTSCPGE
jgi:hypothetical protein